MQTITSTDFIGLVLIGFGMGVVILLIADLRRFSTKWSMITGLTAAILTIAGQWGLAFITYTEFNVNTLATPIGVVIATVAMPLLGSKLAEILPDRFMKWLLEPRHTSNSDNA